MRQSGDVAVYLHVTCPPGPHLLPVLLHLLNQRGDITQHHRRQVLGDDLVLPRQVRRLVHSIPERLDAREPEGRREARMLIGAFIFTGRKESERFSPVRKEG